MHRILLASIYDILHIMEKNILMLSALAFVVLSIASCAGNEHIEPAPATLTPELTPSPSPTASPSPTVYYINTFLNVSPCFILHFSFFIIPSLTPCTSTLFLKTFQTTFLSYSQYCGKSIAKSVSPKRYYKDIL